MREEAAPPPPFPPTLPRVHHQQGCSSLLLPFLFHVQCYVMTELYCAGGSEGCSAMHDVQELSPVPLQRFDVQ